MSSSTVPTDRGARTGAAAYVPIAGFCCLGLILLFIASTIVLALIPIYLPRKTIPNLSTSASKYFTLSQSGRVPANGATTSSACSTIAQRLTAATGAPSGTLNPKSCTFARKSAGRRRRSRSSNRALRQSQAVQLFMVADLLYSICPICRSSTYIEAFIGTMFTATFPYGTTTYTITFTLVGIQSADFVNLVTQATTTTTATTQASVTSNAPSG